MKIQEFFFNKTLKLKLKGKVNCRVTVLRGETEDFFS